MLKRAILVLAAITVLVVGLALPRIIDAALLLTGWGLPVRVGPPIEIVAHRGDLQAFPEDTAEAIWAAAELPVDGIELDAHASADGTWFVIHDPTLDGSTDATGRISELHDAEIAAAIIDGGFGFSADRHAGLRVPPLAAVLEGLRAFGGTIYVDIQHADAPDDAEIATLVAQLDGFDAAVLCETTHEAAMVKSRNPDVRVLMRRHVGDRSNVDGWLLDASEVSAEAVAAADLPIVVFVGEAAHGRDEFPYLRRAWATGAAAFLAKDPAAALLMRGQLQHPSSTAE